MYLREFYRQTTRSFGWKVSGFTPHVLETLTRYLGIQQFTYFFRENVGVFTNTHILGMKIERDAYFTAIRVFHAKAFVLT